jgi:hypothetical protein
VDSSLATPLGFNLREHSPWNQLLLTRTSLPPGHHENIWSKWTRVWWFLELVLRLLASDYKDQPPLPDHHENLLIWVDLIKVIHLGFAQYILWVPSRSQLIPATLIFHSNKLTFNWLYVYILLSVLRIVHCAFISHSFYSDILLFRNSLSHCLVINYCQLLSFLCIIMILEMYSGISIL